MVCVKCGKTLDAVDLYEILFKFAEYFDRCLKCQPEPIPENQTLYSDDIYVPGMPAR